jgi:hypothetical protein
MDKEEFQKKYDNSILVCCTEDKIKKVLDSIVDTGIKKLILERLNKGFEVGEDYKDNVKKAFENWYKNSKPPKLNDEEQIMSFYFKSLCDDLIFRLDYIILKSSLEQLKDKTERHINLIQNIQLLSTLRSMPDGNKIIENLEKKLGQKF